MGDALSVPFIVSWFPDLGWSVGLKKKNGKKISSSLGM